jgi:hypothetical protein
VRCLATIFLLIAAALVLWLFYSCVSDLIEGVGIQRHWKALRVPYTAHVIGLVDRGGVKAKDTALAVEIRFADGTKKQFISSRCGSLHLLGVGSEVRVLTNTTQMFGQSWDIYEIDSSFELWVKDLLWATSILCFVIGIPLWVFRPLGWRS